MTSKKSLTPPSPPASPGMSTAKFEQTPLEWQTEAQRHRDDANTAAQVGQPLAQWWALREAIEAHKRSARSRPSISRSGCSSARRPAGRPCAPGRRRRGLREVDPDEAKLAGDGRDQV